MYKDIPGFKNYEISQEGIVIEKAHINVEGYSIPSQIVNQWTDHGYLRVDLYSGNSRKKRLVHRLVALTWISNIDPKRKCVNHIDGNKRNNCVTNLEWVTGSENLKHSYQTGLRTARRSEPPRKLTKEKVLEIVADLDKAEISKNQIAKKHGISRSNLTNIDHGHTWSQITGRGKINFKKLKKEETVKAIKQDLTCDLTIRQIAIKYGVSKGVVENIKYGKSWTHI